MKEPFGQNIKVFNFLLVSCEVKFQRSNLRFPVFLKEKFEFVVHRPGRNVIGRLPLARFFWFVRQKDTSDDTKANATNPPRRTTNAPFIAGQMHFL